MSNLFQLGSFVLAGGDKSDFKIDCDALTWADIETLAYLLACRLPAFTAVEGVPRGGLTLAEAMRKYSMPEGDRLLIVDDVYTTGISIERHRRGRAAIGGVLFARAQPPEWIKVVFQLTK